MCEQVIPHKNIVVGAIWVGLLPPIFAAVRLLPIFRHRPRITSYPKDLR